MLIPSIDLMGGKIVQLVQGERLALEFSDFDEWVAKFRKFPLVQLIDLDAATGRGDNAGLVEEFVRRLPCQVGGGIRSIERARELLERGASRVIFGSALVRDGGVDRTFAEELARALGREHLTFAIDTKNGCVAVRGWRERTTLEPAEMIRALQSYCDAFLYTHVDTEGLLRGFPMDVARSLRAATAKKLIAAGGICTHEEVQQLHAMQIDAVVGMAIYTCGTGAPRRSRYRFMASSTISPIN
jgi:phosphoribosylformimino-5-aminoimidazole carboxamide ribotide isomerase